MDRIEKNNIRQKIKAVSRNLSPEELQNQSALIASQLKNSLLFQKANAIFCYLNYYRWEVKTQTLCEEIIRSGKLLLLPRIEPSTKKMQALQVSDFTTLKKNIFQIKEPPLNDLDQIFDLAIVPGLAFGLNGERLGSGGGYYDRFFAKISSQPLIVALAYDFQIIEMLPHHEHDLQLHYLITAQGVRQLSG
jgi:5-formyltetrahydrofolate cyclo-ligase